MVRRASAHAWAIIFMKISLSLGSASAGESEVSVKPEVDSSVRTSDGIRSDASAGVSFLTVTAPKNTFRLLLFRTQNGYSIGGSADQNKSEYAVGLNASSSMEYLPLILDLGPRGVIRGAASTSGVSGSISIIPAQVSVAGHHGGSASSKSIGGSGSVSNISISHALAAHLGLRSRGVDEKFNAKILITSNGANCGWKSNGVSLGDCEAVPVSISIEADDEAEIALNQAFRLTLGGQVSTNLGDAELAAVNLGTQVGVIYEPTWQNSSDLVLSLTTSLTERFGPADRSSSSSSGSAPTVIFGVKGEGAF